MNSAKHAVSNFEVENVAIQLYTIAIENDAIDGSYSIDVLCAQVALSRACMDELFFGGGSYVETNVAT